MLRRVPTDGLPLQAARRSCPVRAIENWLSPSSSAVICRAGGIAVDRLPKQAERAMINAAEDIATRRVSPSKTWEEHVDGLPATGQPLVATSRPAIHSSRTGPGMPTHSRRH
jgi:hypothetical protein